MPAAKPESYYLDGLNKQGLFDFKGWVGPFIGARTRAFLSCKKCGNMKDAAIWSVVSSCRGCPSCAKESSSSKQRSDEADVIRRLEKSRNVKFIRWVDGEYKNQRCKATVRCLNDECGYEWSSVTYSMLHGCGCMKCGKKSMAAKQSKSIDERVAELSSIDGLTFVEWEKWMGSCLSKAVMMCDYGHKFTATVNSITSKGTGCPTCAHGGFDQSLPGAMYALRSSCGKFIKVGISNSFDKRMHDLKRKTPFDFMPIELIYDESGKKIRKLEKYYHDKYERAGLVGFDGCTEWLVCTSELLAELRTKRP